ncbi:hypothetical protein EXU57_19970 [Segetibacter sp. 3557_3]|uniref:hypothetical protein n=1 Tax=Segetibacter sp. 3557_3 TaxID=2547429 RepID=UPI001058C4B0|nr:hypothetical protein [Segetibacter sp. 3557_3]TDH21474.1 hypothetical protein EXU57_19970 [Segetibacter sp. 3557_3]
MYQGLVHLHNLGRWVVIVLLFLAIINAIRGLSGTRPYGKGDSRVALFLMIAAHIMLLVGLYQWIAGPWGLQNIQNLGMGGVMKDSVYRFWAIEHITGMLIAIILITIGKGVGRKQVNDATKHRRSFWLFLVAMIIILVTVPWPFREVARPLFPGGSV